MTGKELLNKLNYKCLSEDFYSKNSKTIEFDYDGIEIRTYHNNLELSKDTLIALLGILKYSNEEVFNSVIEDINKLEEEK